MDEVMRVEPREDIRVLIRKGRDQRPLSLRYGRTQLHRRQLSASQEGALTKNPASPAPGALMSASRTVRNNTCCSSH